MPSIFLKTKQVGPLYLFSIGPPIGAVNYRIVYLRNQLCPQRFMYTRFPDPTNSFLIRKLLTAVSRCRQSDIRLPISRPVLHELVRSLPFTNSSAFQQTLHRTTFLLAFYGFFWISELAAKNARSVSTIVQFSALRFFPRFFSHGKSHFLKLVISEYKHNINNHPFEVLIAREDCPAQFCLVQPLLDYLAVEGQSPRPTFL